MSELKFSGQSAIVTGGADGIGKAISIRLAEDGAAITLFDISESKLAAATEEFRSRNLQVHTAVVNIAEDVEVKNAVAKVVERTGRLDVVIHCAGIVGPNGVKIADINVEDFDRVCETNLRGSFLITKHSLPAMLSNSYGRVLLFASIAGKEGNAGMCCYSASKAGVIGLTKAVGKEYAETNVTINAIAPAVIRTGMVEAMQPEQVKYMTDKIPMKRCGTLEEISSLACWIVSREASFTTGFTYDMTGGRATY